MSVTEKAQAAIITAHIRAAISYTRDTQAGEPPEAAFFWATTAALTIEFITLEGARKIAAAVAQEYESYHVNALTNALHTALEPGSDSSQECTQKSHICSRGVGNEF